MPELTVKTLSLAHMPPKSVWVRLGFRETASARAEIPASFADMVSQFTVETRVRIFFSEKPFAVTPDGLLYIGEYRFASRLVLERFGRPSSVLVMAASALPEDVDRIRAYQEAEDLQRAVILDAVLSEKTDFGLDFIEQEIAVELRRTGRTAGRRLSCGYGDFSLEHQKFFYNTLDLARYGIGLSERNILTPEKTVTALLPIYAGENPVHD